MSRARDSSAKPAPAARGAAAPGDCPAVEGVLENVRGLLRQLNAGPAFRNHWEYRFAGLAAAVWPEGLDRGHLADLGLGRRTRRCLDRAGLLWGTAAFTTRDLLLPEFGKWAYRDLLAGIERFLGALADDPAAYVPKAMGPELAGLARRAADGRIAPSELATFGAGLKSAVAILRVRLDGVVAGLTPRQRAAARFRLLEEPRPTFAAIGRRLGVTGSRVQQLCAAVERRAGRAAGLEAPFAAAILGSRLGHVVGADAWRRHLDAAAGRGDGLGQRLLRKVLVERMDYIPVRDAYVDGEARAVIGRIRDRASARVDDAGLLDEAELLAMLPDGDWRAHWETLRECAGLHALHGLLAMRRDARARTKAALLSLGRPATRGEIAGASGLTGDEAGRWLKRLPSVVRATRAHWALAGWVDEG